MLHIFLVILKIIGMILAILVGILLLVLLIPFSYVGKGNFKEVMKASFVAKWLQGLIYFRFSYVDGEMQYVLRILGIPVLKGSIGEEEEELADKDFKELARDFEKNVVDDNKQQPNEKKNSLEEFNRNISKEISINLDKKEDNDKREIRDIQREQVKNEEVTEKPMGIRLKICNIKSKFCNFVKDFKNLKKKIRNIKKFLKSKKTKIAYYYAKDIIKKIYHHIKPSKFEADLIFGFDSPDRTGKVLAMFGVLYGTVKINPEKISILPDFETKRLEGKLFCKGNFMAGYVLLQLFKLYFKKEVQEVIERIHG